MYLWIQNSTKGLACRIPKICEDLSGESRPAQCKSSKILDVCTRSEVQPERSGCSCSHDNFCVDNDKGNKEKTPNPPSIMKYFEVE